MGPIVSIVFVVYITALGLVLVKFVDQRTRDRNRKTYRLSFPSELSGDSVTAWLRSISGTLRYGPTRISGVPTVAFEMWASSRGIVHRLKVPWQHADYVIAQLRSLVPGIRVVPEEEFPRRLWTRAVEVGLTHSSRQLRIPSLENMSASLLASVQALEEGEAVVMQWVVTPAVPSHPPIHKETISDHTNYRTFLNGNLANRDEVKDRRDKLHEPNMQAVLRIGSQASTTIRADHLIYRVRASLAGARTAATRFHKRFVSTGRLQRRIDNTASSLFFPMQLSAPELTALIAWPIGNPFVSGLPPAMARHLPASDHVPREGRIIGRSNFPGNERLVALAYEDARKHMHVMGPTGVGKTVLLANMLKQDIENGYGVVLIENKGDLFYKALNYIPQNRLNDVIVLDVNDTKRPVGFNILEQGDSRVVIDEIVALFDHLYKDARSVWTREVLYHGLLTLATDPKFTFVDLAPLLVPMTSDEIAWADQVTRGLKDRELRNFWQRFQNQPRAAQDRITAPVMDRIWQLNARPEMRNIIGQSHSSFHMVDVVRDNKILLVNLSGLAKDTSALTGTLLMNALWHAVKTTRSEQPTFLYLDEFQDFMNLPVEPEDMLAKSRGFNLGMVLAHQHLGQLRKEVKDAVSANARTKLVFQSSVEDARQMAREFGSSVEEFDFMNLGRYEALARVATGEGVSPPLTLTTNYPAKGTGLAANAVSMSRQVYGRLVSDVESDINKRRTLEQAPKTRRPSIGSDVPWS